MAPASKNDHNDPKNRGSDKNSPDNNAPGRKRDASRPPDGERSVRRAPWSYDPDRKCVAHPEGCDECNAYLNHLDSHQAAQVSALKHAREIMVSSLAKDEQHAGYQKGFRDGQQDAAKELEAARKPHEEIESLRTCLRSSENKIHELRKHLGFHREALGVEVNWDAPEEDAEFDDELKLHRSKKEATAIMEKYAEQERQAARAHREDERRLREKARATRGDHRLEADGDTIMVSPPHRPQQDPIPSSSTTARTQQPPSAPRAHRPEHATDRMRAPSRNTRERDREPRREYQQGREREEERGRHRGTRADERRRSRSRSHERGRRSRSRPHDQRRGLPYDDPTVLHIRDYPREEYRGGGAGGYAPLAPPFAPPPSAPYDQGRSLYGGEYGAPPPQYRPDNGPYGSAYDFGSYGPGPYGPQYGYQQYPPRQGPPSVRRPPMGVYEFGPCPTDTGEIDRIFAEAQRPGSNTAVNKLRYWVARTSQQGRALTPAERHLAQIWRPPQWWAAVHQPEKLKAQSIPKPEGQVQPSLTDPVKDWVAFLKRRPTFHYRGIQRDPQNHAPTWESTQGYLWMAQWVDLPAGPRRRWRDTLWGIVAPIFAHQAYGQELEARGLTPAADLNMVPYDGIFPPTTDSTIRHLAVRCGVSPAHIAPALRAWAEQWIAAAPVPEEAYEMHPAATTPTAATTTATAPSHTAQTEAERLQGPISTTAAGPSHSMSAAATVTPSPPAKGDEDDDMTGTTTQPAAGPSSS